MTKQLIINSVNMLDPRAIGLKCIFGSNREVVDTLQKIRFDEYDNTEFVSYIGIVSGHCRIAQGDKTAYDGKGQPVPDGVIIDVWGVNALSGDYLAGPTKVEHFEWGEHCSIHYYQVQEMPVEQEDTFRQRVIKDLLKNKVAVSEETKTITAKLHSEIVANLKRLHAIITVSPPNQFRERDRNNIDKILAELNEA